MHVEETVHGCPDGYRGGLPAGQLGHPISASQIRITSRAAAFGCGRRPRYVEYEQEFIDELQREIGPEHPLYRREVFAIAVRRDPDAVIFQTADGEIYAIVHLTWSGRRAVGMPMTELLENRQAVGQRITADHAEWLEQYKRLQDD